MPSDKNNKTVFKQPGHSPDRTVIRPAPGGRGAAPTAPTAPADPAIERQTTQSASTRYQPQQQVQYQPQPSVSTTSADSRVFVGMNPLVDAASTLIAVFSEDKTVGISFRCGWIASTSHQ